MCRDISTREDAFLFPNFRPPFIWTTTRQVYQEAGRGSNEGVFALCPETFYEFPGVSQVIPWEKEWRS